MSEPKQPGAGSGLRKLLVMPHTYVLLVIIILLAALLTYVIPAGEFERAEDVNSGRTVVVPGSYEETEASPFNPLLFPVSIVEGFNDSSDIIFFILIIGGTFQIIMSTGAIDAVTGRTTRLFSKRSAFVIPAFLALFSVGGFTMGMSTESMVFVPIGILIARSLGYDAITGTAMVILGSNIGFTAGLLNPFSVGVAQSIAEVPLFSGMWLRAIILILLLIITSLYIIRYANKVKQDQRNSLVYELETEQNQADIEGVAVDSTITGKHMMAISVFLIGIIVLLWGVSVHEWYILEISSLFLAMGIVAGLVSGYGPSRISKEFVKGAKSIVMGALMIGLARAVIVVLEDGAIIDTIVFYASTVVDTMPSSLQVLGMYLFQVFVNLFITSGSGQAAITMPIMTPLGDLLGVTRQTGVLAFQLGDGFTNLINPTSSTLMGALAVSGIAFQKWFRFAWPLIVIWIVFGGIMVVIANLIHYQ
ncbi:AbgT family transporter [Alkalihalobacillus oceani]|uniref:AbgT family transporter n=1 Tax=Halalkalibacter oceani TaxID=1653776 RepID=A0A9X2DPI6_9BACI|nr:TIGR00366 family protein [Halalkalibacter oceani]MCM3714731.1 AbgT family transporter [Halalkalibacter oceani]